MTTEELLLEVGDWVVLPGTKVEHQKNGLKVHGAVGNVKKKIRNTDLVEVLWRENKVTYKRTHSPSALAKIDVSRYKAEEPNQNAGQPEVEHSDSTDDTE